MIWNSKRLWLFLLIVGIAVFSPAALRAETTEPIETTIEKEISKARELEEWIKQHPYAFGEHRRGFDIESLELISAREEPARLYELLPDPSAPRYKGTTVNLYRRVATATNTPWKLDMRLSTKIAFESRSPYVDAIAIFDPLQRRMSFGLGHEFGNGTSLQTFVDPLRQTLLGLLTHRFTPTTELALILFRSQREDKTDVVLNYKFRF